MTVRILQGDCIDVMRTLDAESIDAIVTDPPYGLEFMGKSWDTFGKDTSNGYREKPRLTDRTDSVGGYASSTTVSVNSYQAGRPFQEWCEKWAREALRVLKPGGHLLAFGGTRTYHRMACAIEDAGFEVRDQLGWLYGSGFPKSRNLTGDWQGWGTALKPAWEPIVLARKPLVGTVAANVLAHGVGALNIDACRVDASEGRPLRVLDAKETDNNTYAGRMDGGSLAGGSKAAGETNLGRWPANVIHDGSDGVLAAFPNAPGQIADASTSADARKTQNVYGAMRRGRGDESSADSDNAGAVGFKMRPGARRLDEGSAARFFYCAKTSRAERNMGCSELLGVQGGMVSNTSGQHITRRDGGAPAPKNGHPTVKPIALMRYLVRLVTPPGGTVLDPFLGSGSTACACVFEGFDCIGIEKDTKSGYIAIAEARVKAAQEWREEIEADQAARTAQSDMFAEVASA